MTGKIKVPTSFSANGKHELEISKLRNENRWMKLIEFSQNTLAKDKKFGIHFKVLLF
jgi:hypothetical protein